MGRWGLFTNVRIPSKTKCRILFETESPNRSIGMEGLQSLRVVSPQASVMSPQSSLFYKAVL
jgi:hypothetical protein